MILWFQIHGCAHLSHLQRSFNNRRIRKLCQRDSVLYGKLGRTKHGAAIFSTAAFSVMTLHDITKQDTQLTTHMSASMPSVVVQSGVYTERKCYTRVTLQLTTIWNELWP
jgi:hypothetical protein